MFIKLKSFWLDLESKTYLEMRKTFEQFVYYQPGMR